MAKLVAVSLPLYRGEGLRHVFHRQLQRMAEIVAGWVDQRVNNRPRLPRSLKNEEGCVEIAVGVVVHVVRTAVVADTGVHPVSISTSKKVVLEKFSGHIT